MSFTILHRTTGLALLAFLFYGIDVKYTVNDPTINVKVYVLHGVVGGQQDFLGIGLILE